MRFFFLRDPESETEEIGTVEFKFFLLFGTLYNEVLLSHNCKGGMLISKNHFEHGSGNSGPWVIVRHQKLMMIRKVGVHWRMQNIFFLDLTFVRYQYQHLYNLKPQVRLTSWIPCRVILVLYVALAGCCPSCEKGLLSRITGYGCWVYPVNSPSCYKLNFSTPLKTTQCKRGRSKPAGAATGPSIWHSNSLGCRISVISNVLAIKVTWPWTDIIMHSHKY